MDFPELFQFYSCCLYEALCTVTYRCGYKDKLVPVFYTPAAQNFLKLSVSSSLSLSLNYKCVPLYMLLGALRVLACIEERYSEHADVCAALETSLSEPFAFFPFFAAGLLHVVFSRRTCSLTNLFLGGENKTKQGKAYMALLE